MRVTSIGLSGFRAFSGRVELDVDADAVIVIGANGQGKTSLLDTILWAIAGEVPRLGSNESVVSVYSDSGEARVALGLRAADGQTANLVRSFDGKEAYLSLELDSETYRGPQAESRLLELLWSHALVAADPPAALRSALERGVYLQQDLVLDFIQAATDQDRFAVISELVGAGRIRELQTSLERSRNAWSRVTNVRNSEAEELAERLSALEARIAAAISSEDEAAVPPELWDEWWKRATTLGLTQTVVPPDSLEAPSVLDEAVRGLEALQQSLDRRRTTAVALRAEFEAVSPPPEVDVAALQEAQQTAERALAAAREQLSLAETEAGEVRRRQVQMHEDREELRTFAVLALRHLADRCPVCEQTYDREETRKRLEVLARGDGEAVEPPPVMPDVAGLADAVAEREQELAATRRRLADAQEAFETWRARQADLATRLAALEIEGEPDAAASERVAALESHLTQSVAALAAHRDEGERLALELARAGQRARRVELDSEAKELRGALDALRDEVRLRQQTYQRVSTMIDAVREAGSDIVEEELTRLEQLLQRIYATADPHPTFRIVKLLSRMQQGRGRVVAAVADPHPEYKLEREAPHAVLSSSQMNVLAVSVFLALNLGMPALPLRTAILDDPLQSLDDLNLLGLIDLLRRMRQRRQLFVSTHDARFGELLARKLRPVETRQRTISIELEGWDRGGPTVQAREVPREQEPLRIAAAA